jgi:hypothetical protein
MKKILLILSSITIHAFSQTPSLQWSKSVSGQLSGYDNTQNSWKDPSGNFLITGTTSNDAFLLKVDNSGNELLRIIWDGPQSNSDNGSAVKADAAGNIYMAGLTYYNGMNVPFVVKYSASGVKQWQYVQTNVSVAGNITAIALDNYNSPANLYFTGSKNDSSAIIKLDANTGHSLWEKTLWPHGQMNDIDIDNNGHPLVCGYQAFTGIDADFYAAVLDINTGYPLRGCWRDGAAADSVTNGSGYFDKAMKIKAGPAGSFVVFGTIYDNANEATMYMAKFGSTGNVPTWTYSYNSPTHTGGKGVQLFADASFSNFYYLATAFSTSGIYYNYTIAGKVNNTGSAIWEKEFSLAGASLDPHDMAIDANGNAHIISDAGYPDGDIYYKKLASANGNVIASLQYDNQRGGGSAYDLSSNIFLDNTGHPYVIGSSNAFTYTNLDVLMYKLNTNATLDWDITYDFFISSQNTAFNVQTMPTNGSGAEQIVTCGRVINNLTNTDISITSYSDKGIINWQETFDDNNGADQVIGFEKSNLNNLFLCSFNNSNNTTSITEFYSDGTTNFSNKPSWLFHPTCFKIDSAENSFASSGNNGSTDFNLGIYLRNGTALSNTPSFAANRQANATSITTDNNGVYVAGDLFDYNGGVTDRQHIYIQKYDLAGNKIWSTKISGLDSSVLTNNSAVKIVFDRTSGALYLVGKGTLVGSAIDQTILAKISQSGNVIWVKAENASNTRYQYMNDIKVKNSKIYITGYAYTVTNTSDNMMLTEAWDINGNKQWEYIYDKANTDEEGASVSVDNTGIVFVGGKTNGVSNTNSNMLLTKIDATGNLIWKQEYNGASNGNDYTAGIALSNSNTLNPRIYMAGNVQSTGYNFDIATLKYCDLPVTHVSHLGSTSICQNSSTNLVATGTASGNIVWASGGSAAASINVTTSGNYYFTYTEADGCTENSDTVTIHLKSPPTPVQICMVTVDSLSTHNIITWDKTAATPDVIGFKMYREDLTNIYSYIGSVSIDSLSEFHDYGVNPNVTTKRYKISAIDSCGNESALSNYHNTIYIVDVGNGQYLWNPIYTIENTANPVTNYVLMRDDNNTGNFLQIASTAGTSNTLNDVNYASYPLANWRVDALGFNCNPTLRLAGNNNTLTARVRSHSNQNNNRVAGVNQLIGNVSQLTVYPNPSIGSVTVSNSQKIDALKVSDVLGNVIYETKPNEQKVVLHLETAGVYFIAVISGKETSIKKVVINN